MADATLALRKTVAEFYEVDEGQVGPSFSLNTGRGRTSIARAALDAAIRRRVGVKSDRVYSARTFGELIGEAAGEPSMPATAPVPATATSADRPAIGCGIDLETIAALPDAADCWEHPFYREHFTPAEIAYCQLQPDPAPHFAARWSAKEALRKADPAFAAVPWDAIEVGREPSGAPFLNDLRGGVARRLPHSLSLSHTDQVAAAVVVIGASAPAIPAATPAVAPTEQHAPPMPAGRGRNLLPLLVSLVALGLAVAALLRASGALPS